MNRPLVEWFRNGGECAERGEECRVRDAASGCTCTAAADTIASLKTEASNLRGTLRLHKERADTLTARVEKLEGALAKMQRSRDRYRQAWEAEKVASAAITKGEKND